MSLLRSVCHLVVCTLLLGYASAESWAKTYTFDSAADLSQFAAQGVFGTLYGAPEWVANGLGGPGGVRPVGSPAYVYLASTERSFRLSEVGDSISSSVMFYFKNPTILSNGGGRGENIIWLGVASDANYSNGLPMQLNAGLILTQGSPSQPISTSVQVSGTANGSGNGQTFTIPTLADDRWYRLSATFSIVDDPIKPNRFDVALDDFGSDGSTFVANLTTNTWNDVLMTPFKDKSAWAGFHMSRYPSLGAEVVDNFTIVPEPLAPAIMTPIALAMALFARRHGRLVCR